LPTYSFAEKVGTFTNTERRIQLINPFLEPQGEAKNDWAIFQTIANKMGYKWSYLNAEDIMNEVSQLVSQYSSVNYSCIKEKGVQWPVKDCVGTEIMHTEKFTRGKGMFIPAHWKKPSEYADEQYPFILTTGRIYYQYHTGTMTRKINTLEREAPEPYVEISPNDAKKYNIKNEEYVLITSRYGSLTVKVKISDMVMDEILFMPFHYYEAPANKITNPTLDPISKIPELKVTAVRLEKAEKRDDLNAL
jgi:predicted molibdopterin-dependent oxidoreductase YjgC